MANEWVMYQGRYGKKPEERKYVLLRLEGNGILPPAVVVGYLRYAAGCKDSPQWIMPGVEFTFCREVTHWCDCLGDDFEVFK